MCQKRLGSPPHDSSQEGEFLGRLRRPRRPEMLLGYEKAERNGGVGNLQVTGRGKGESQADGKVLEMGHRDGLTEEMVCCW